MYDKDNVLCKHFQPLLKGACWDRIIQALMNCSEIAIVSCIMVNGISTAAKVKVQLCRLVKVTTAERYSIKYLFQLKDNYMPFGLLLMPWTMIFFRKIVLNNILESIFCLLKWDLTVAYFWKQKNNKNT